MKEETIYYDENNQKIKVLTYHNNDELKAEANFKNDQLHGLFKSYLDTGHLKSECFFEFGKLNGCTICYDTEGNITQKMFFVDGLLDGLFSHYDNSQLQLQISYVKGKKNGLMISYAANGNKKQIANYENDIQSGECITYDENSLEVVMKCQFNKGKKHGKSYIYYPNSNGKIYEESVFENNLLEGFLTRYDANGQVQQICEYIKGKQTGTPVSFNAQGEPIEEISSPQVKNKVGLWKLLFG